MNYRQICIDREIMSGTPVFVGTRVPIQTLFDYIEGSDALEDFLNDYLSVTKEAAIEVLKMAKPTLINEKILKENFA
jgi:uncharacterized protein (DUF433 family)